VTPTSILGPVFALAALTFVILGLIPFVRFRAAFAGKVVADDFKLGESARVPPDVALANRNYMNLLELPLLFYVGCITAYFAHTVDQPLVMLAWLYVGLRVLHSLIHTTYNNVFHRLAVFATSNLVLLALWIRLFVRLFVSAG
jgi:hypothetical protein